MVALCNGWKYGLFDMFYMMAWKKTRVNVDFSYILASLYSIHVLGLRKPRVPKVVMHVVRSYGSDARYKDVYGRSAVEGQGLKDAKSDALKGHHGTGRTSIRNLFLWFD